MYIQEAFKQSVANEDFPIINNGFESYSITEGTEIQDFIREVDPPYLFDDCWDVGFLVKEKIGENDMKKFYGQYMVRTYSAGVFYGEIEEWSGDLKMKMKNARRVWYWDGAASLSQLAEEGSKEKNSCKMPRKVSELWLTEVIEVIKLSDEAYKNLEDIKVWER